MQVERSNGRESFFDYVGKRFKETHLHLHVHSLQILYFICVMTVYSCVLCFGYENYPPSSKRNRGFDKTKQNLSNQL